jgi:hypothetical protein
MIVYWDNVTIKFFPYNQCEEIVIHCNVGVRKEGSLRLPELYY